jgi:hypothetical protein
MCHFSAKKRLRCRRSAQLRVELWTVDESRKKRPLADDFGFISSLSDLDRGLMDAGADDSSDVGTNNPVAAPRLIRRRIRRRVRRLPAPRRLVDPVFLYVRRTVVPWERVPTVPVSALPRTRPADDNCPASSAI